MTIEHLDEILGHHALFKGLSLAVLGSWVLGSTVWGVFAEGVPHAATMGAVGIAALVANVVSALLLFRFRDGDVSHGRSHLAGEDQYSCPGLGRWSVWGRSDCLLLGPP